MPKLVRQELLFTPNPEGLAHIIRSSVLADAMTRLGHKCILAIPKEHKNIVRKITKNVAIETLNFKSDPAKLFKKVSEEFGKSGTLSRVNYDNLTDPYIPVVEKYPKSIAVVDSHPFARASIVFRKMSNVWIGTPGAMPYLNRIPGISNKALNGVSSQLITRKLANSIYQFLYLVYVYMRQDGYDERVTIKHIESDTAKLPKLVFETKNSDIFNETSPNFFTAEPIFSQLEIGNQRQIEKYKKFIASQKSVFISFGGTGYSPHMIKTLVRELLDSDYAVICSMGKILEDGELQHHPRLLIEKFTPGIPVALAVDAIISHGSQGYVEQALVTKTPIIALPFNLDQIISVASAKSQIVVNAAPLSLLKIGKLSSSSSMSRHVENTRVKKVLTLLENFSKQQHTKPSLNVIEKINHSRVQHATKILEDILQTYYED